MLGEFLICISSTLNELLLYFELIFDDWFSAMDARMDGANGANATITLNSTKG